MHNDTSLEVLKSYGHTSIPLLKKGKIGAIFWAAFMDCSTQEKTALRAALEQIDVIKRFVHEYDDIFQFAKTSNDIIDAHEQGKIASLIGKQLLNSFKVNLSKLNIMKISQDLIF